MDHRTKWLVLAPLGMVAVGLGSSIAGDATLAKGRGAPALRWVAEGTLGLCCLNAGLALIGDAVKHRLLYELGRPSGA